MNFERIAIFQAIGQSNQNNANIIAEANARIRFANGELDRAKDIIADKDDVIAQKDQEIAKLKAMLEIEILNRTGNKAQATALKNEVIAKDPGNHLIQKTGKTYPDGMQQTKLQAIFDQAFDAEAIKRGHKAPHKYRAVAQ